jgi:hypothetical protein
MPCTRRGYIYARGCQGISQHRSCPPTSTTLLDVPRTFVAPANQGVSAPSCRSSTYGYVVLTPVTGGLPSDLGCPRSAIVSFLSLTHAAACVPRPMPLQHIPLPKNETNLTCLRHRQAALVWLCVHAPNSVSLFSKGRPCYWRSIG